MLKCKELNYQDNGSWEFKLSFTYYIISQYENALNYIIIADEFDPEDSDYLFLYFLILLKMNKNEKCKIILQKIKKIDNNLYSFGLGYYNFKKEKLKEKKDSEILMLKYINYYKNNVLEKDHIKTVSMCFYSNLMSEYYDYINDYSNSILYLDLSIKYGPHHGITYFKKCKITTNSTTTTKKMKHNKKDKNIDQKNIKIFMKKNIKILMKKSIKILMKKT